MNSESATAAVSSEGHRRQLDDKFCIFKDGVITVLYECRYVGYSTSKSRQRMEMLKKFSLLCHGVQITMFMGNPHTLSYVGFCDCQCQKDYRVAVVLK